MALNHSNTWPVSTLAVVQLRVDPNGRTYSTLLDPDCTNAEIGESKQNGVAQCNVFDPEKIMYDEGNGESSCSRDVHEQHNSEHRSPSNSNGILPLSQQHVEMFTRAHTPHPYKTTIRTDTVSTILEQDIDFDLDIPVVQNGNNEDIKECRRFEKFRVLAMARIDESIHESECRGRRPSAKVDNWDLIYTERDKRCTGRCNEAMAAYTCKSKSLKEYTDRLLPPDLPLDARKVTTLRRHYYPEGGWGWVIIVCTVLVHILNIGLQLSCSQLVVPGAEKFKTLPVHLAGK